MGPSPPCRGGLSNHAVSALPSTRYRYCVEGCSAPRTTRWSTTGAPVSLARRSGSRVPYQTRPTPAFCVVQATVTRPGAGSSSHGPIATGGGGACGVEGGSQPAMASVIARARRDGLANTARPYCARSAATSSFRARLLRLIAFCACTLPSAPRRALARRSERMSDPSGMRGRMPEQLSFAHARRRQGLRLAVLPDASRVEERLRRLAREPGRGIVVGKAACSIAELERELVREAQRAGTCPAQASVFALRLALREAARDHSQGPYFAIRREPGYARALGELSSALTQGLVAPADLLTLDVPERVRALGSTLQAAGEALSRAGLVDPHRAVRLGLDLLEQQRKLPGFLAHAAELVFEDILDWTPLRLRLLA